MLENATVSLWKSWGTMPYHTELLRSVWLFLCRHAVLVKSHPFCMTLDLQLSFYRLLCYNSIAQCHLLQCLRTTSAVLADAHSYFVISPFKCEGKNSRRDLILNPRRTISNIDKIERNMKTI